MEKREKIEEMYFTQKMSLTQIAQEMQLSISYVSRILRENKSYRDEQERRKQENQVKRRQMQKDLIYKSRKEKAVQRIMENQVLKRMHEQAVKELSKGRTLGNNALRKWTTVYKYNREKHCYEFDANIAKRPCDFPRYINI